MLSLTLILLLAVEAQKNRAPVCAIGLKKGARVRLPGGARRASPALQIRVRKQLPIPIIPGAHVATLKNCREDVGAFRQTSTSASAGPSMGRMTTRACRWRSRSAYRHSSGPTTTRSSRFLEGGSRGGRKLTVTQVVIPARRSRSPGRPYQKARRASSDG